MKFTRQVTGTTYGKSVYPAYDAADLGFENYWYPVMFSGELGRKPASRTVCGEKIAFFREQGKVYALRDRCPHRGVPLSLGRREFPGTIACVYHGWVFDLETGALKAVLTDGPDCPLIGAKRVCAQTYPVTEFANMIWVYIGQGEPPPLADQIPDTFMKPGFTSIGRIIEREGDWRHATENGYDEGHAKYLHRTSVWTLLRYLPAWSTIQNITSEDGKWLTRFVGHVGWQTEYPGLGVWPANKPFWKFTKGMFGRSARVSVRLPCLLKVEYVGHWWHSYEWYVPTETGRHRYVQVMMPERVSALEMLRMQVWFWLYLRWVYIKGLYNQDEWMIEVMQTPPEQLYRPDSSIVGWRRLCEESAKAGVTAPRSGSVSAPAVGPAVAEEPADVIPAR